MASLSPAGAVVVGVAEAPVAGRPGAAVTGPAAAGGALVCPDGGLRKHTQVTLNFHVLDIFDIKCHNSMDGV